jgi:hypothetical protein
VDLVDCKTKKTTQEIKNTKSQRPKVKTLHTGLLAFLRT